MSRADPEAWRDLRELKEREDKPSATSRGTDEGCDPSWRRTTDGEGGSNLYESETRHQRPYPLAWKF